MTGFYELLTYSMIGIGLAASCGFRVFVPGLFMSIAVHGGALELSDGWEWIGTWPAMVAFGVATRCEVGGYFIPWFDHLLDTMATPAAVVAGILATSACVSRWDPALAWSFGIIAGGGAAAIVQSGTVLARGASTATTGGAANFLVAGAELAGAVVASFLAIAVPVLACLLFVIFAGLTAWLFVRWRRKKKQVLSTQCSVPAI
jgi:hypothetical protein